MAAFPGIGLTMIDADDVKLGEPLGAGGFGTVYKATHVNWGRVAVKRVYDVRMTEDHQKEAKRMLLSLTSPYLVRIMGLIKRLDGVDIVMELCKNGSLKTFEARYMKCDCWARKIKMIQDIALGMNFLHTLKPPIIHCDLKLENVFVGNGFEAKIGDLGLAASGTKSRKKGDIAGTISHMPPEAFEPDKEYDEAFDIYTFAITTYELTTGRNPWPQLDTYANEKLISVWVGNGYRPKLDVIPTDVPTEIVEIIKRCWAAEPKERSRFKNIVDTVRELFETMYEESLLEADMEISKQMKLVRQSSQRTTESVDSGWESLEAKKLASALQTGNKAAKEAATPKEKDTSVANEVATAKLNQKEIGNYPATTVESNASRNEEEAGKITTDNYKHKVGNDTDVVLDKGMKWKYKHTIHITGYVESSKWIDDQHLALCVYRYVKVYKVTATSSHLAYTVTSKKWKSLLSDDKDVVDVAVSESHPGHMYAICEDHQYVYQFPCHEAKQEEKRYKIPIETFYANLIAASGNVAIMSAFESIIVCSLQDFTPQYTVKVGSYIKDISINSDYLVLMHMSEMTVRYLTGDMKKDLCKINLPDKYTQFNSACIGKLTDGVMDLYAMCIDLDHNCNVIKYILQEPKEGSELQCRCVGSVLKDIQYCNRLSMSANEMMAIDKNIYKLE